MVKGSEGLRTEKMQGKLASRAAQNAMIYLDNVFVPENLRLVKGTNFETSANALLRTSRLQVGFLAAGAMAGAYEAALQYTLNRR